MSEGTRRRGVMETTVLRTADGQAVRIPREYRFETSTVTVEVVSEGLLLRPKVRTVGDTIRSYRAFQAENGIVGGLLEDVNDLPP